MSNTDNLPPGVKMFWDRDGSWRGLRGGGGAQRGSSLLEISESAFKAFRENCRASEITRVILAEAR